MARIVMEDLAGVFIEAPDTDPEDGFPGIGDPSLDPLGEGDPGRVDEEFVKTGFPDVCTIGQPVQVEMMHDAGSAGVLMDKAVGGGLDPARGTHGADESADEGCLAGTEFAG
jgi:hypothetical protein